MKILFVTPYLPHPRSGHGTGVFVYGLLKHLCRRHDITLVSFCDRREMQLASDLESLPMKVLTVRRGKGTQNTFWRNCYLVILRLYQLIRSILRWEPYYVSKFRHPRMHKLIRQLTSERVYDIAQFEMASMAQYRTEARTGVTVLHEHDVALRPAYRQYRRAQFPLKKLLLFIEYCRWSVYERREIRRFDRVLCVTEQDASLMKRLAGTGNINYVPRGVEPVETVPDYESRDPATLLFIGTFSHRPNVDAAMWLASEIFPDIRREHPDTVLYVIGPNPPENLKLLAARCPGVRVLGFVDSVESYLLRCRVFVAPLRFGGGVKVKILHAMAHAIPVVTTRFGAEGIDGLSPSNIVIGDSSARLANQTSELLRHPTTAASIGRKGWETMRRLYSWERTVRQLELIYEQSVRSRSVSSSKRGRSHSSPGDLSMK